MTEETPTALLDLIQLHERIWGTTTYPDRPSLAELLNSPVVAVWVDMQPPNTEGRVAAARRALTEDKSSDEWFKLGAYKTSEELYEALFRVLIVGGPMTCRRLSRVYLNGKSLKITGVRLTVEKDSP